jgi:hypothetical protein
MADAGVPVHVLRKIAGHGSLTTTQRYLHPDRQSIDAAGTALSAHLSARRSPSGPRLRVVRSGMRKMRRTEEGAAELGKHPVPTALYNGRADRI